MVNALEQLLRNRPIWNIWALGVQLLVFKQLHLRKPVDSKPWRSRPPNGQCFWTFIKNTYRLHTLELAGSTWSMSWSIYWTKRWIWNIGTLGVQLFVFPWFQLKKPIDLKPWTSRPPNGECVQALIDTICRFQTLELAGSKFSMSEADRFETSGSRGPIVLLPRLHCRKPIDLKTWKPLPPNGQCAQTWIKNTYQFQTSELAGSKLPMPCNIH